MKIARVNIKASNGHLVPEVITDTFIVPADDWNDQTIDEQLDLIMEYIRDSWSITWRTNENPNDSQ